MRRGSWACCIRGSVVPFLYTSKLGSLWQLRRSRIAVAAAEKLRVSSSHSPELSALGRMSCSGRSQLHISSGDAMVMEMEIEISLPFAAVDALVHACLGGNYVGIKEPRGRVKFEWEQVGEWSSVCRITDKEPGDLGCVRYYGKGTRLTTIQIDGAERPSMRELTARDEFLIRMNLSEQERDEIYKKRRKLHTVIIKRFWSRFNTEAQSIPERQADAPKRQGGRPGLEHGELIYRLAKALEAEQMRSEKPWMKWEDIAVKIEWRHGFKANGLALLRDARHRLDRLRKNDPDGLLQELGGEI